MSSVNSYSGQDKVKLDLSSYRDRNLPGATITLSLVLFKEAVRRTLKEGKCVGAGDLRENFRAVIPSPFLPAFSGDFQYKILQIIHQSCPTVPLRSPRSGRDFSPSDMSVSSAGSNK